MGVAVEPLIGDPGATMSRTTLKLRMQVPIYVLSGPGLVSRTGDVGCTKRRLKVPHVCSSRYHKGSIRA